MSQSVVRIISSILLIGFLGFLVPVNNWHALAHNHTTKHPLNHSDGVAFSQGVEKCTFCDLQLPILFHEEPCFEIHLIHSYEFLFVDYRSFGLPVKETYLSLRGPPVNVIV